MYSTLHNIFSVSRFYAIIPFNGVSVVIIFASRTRQFSMKPEEHYAHTKRTQRNVVALRLECLLLASAAVAVCMWLIKSIMITDRRGFNVSDVEMQAAEQQAAGWANWALAARRAALQLFSMFAWRRQQLFFIAFLSLSCLAQWHIAGCCLNGAAFLLTLSLRQHQVPEERINICAFFAHFSLHASYLNVSLGYFCFLRELLLCHGLRPWCDFHLKHSCASAG